MLGDYSVQILIIICTSSLICSKSVALLLLYICLNLFWQIMSKCIAFDSRNDIAITAAKDW